MMQSPRHKVVHLTSVHNPFDSRIFYKECRSLSKAGYEVTLVAPHERSEIVDGVHIHAVPSPRNRQHRITRTVPTILHAAQSIDANLYHFHDPELIAVGAYLRAQGKCVIYDVHEDTPRQIQGKDWILPWLKRTVSAGVAMSEAVSARYFAGIVAATPKIAERFPEYKTVIVQNFPIINEFELAATTPYDERAAEIVYLGSIARSRGAREIVEALDKLPSELGVRLVLAGRSHTEGLREELELIPGWSHVNFLGWLSRPEVVAVLKRVRVGLVTLHPTVTYVDSYPIKLFEYMAAGIPVVASDFPLWRQIVDNARCGLLVDPLDPAAIAAAIQWLMEHPDEAEAMGRRGMHAVKQKYSWDFEVKNLLELYEAVLG